MAIQASKKCGLLHPDHQRIGSCTSNGIDSNQVSGTFFVLTVSSLSPKASAQRRKRLLALFLRSSAENNEGLSWLVQLAGTLY